MSNRPVRITEEQLKDRTAQLLLTLLEEVSADGRLTDAEVFGMKEWLALYADSQIPGMNYLRNLINDAVADGDISDAESREIISAILRIMPEEMERAAKMRFGSMTEHPDWRIADTPATDCQKRMMTELGVSIPVGCTRSDASWLIAQAAQNSQSFFYLHSMVLRFWGREDLKGYAKESCAWLDRWYEEDPDRFKAWKLWRKEHPDCCSPEGIAEGAGNKYLERVKS